ncbi:hypothetical protein [Niveibacterium sp. SC-1]|uniref:hypothetical protein n=1 Tax=Niveibacterium sp. SC-1 TaxID=3135646 RepID=UPI00311ED126
MQFELNLRDSEVASVLPEGQDLRISFAAAALTRTDIHPAAVGYMNGLVLHLRDTRWKGVPGECIGRLSSGELRIGELVLSRFALPWVASGALSGELQFANGARLQFLAQAGECRLPETPRFNESLACWV